MPAAPTFVEIAVEPKSPFDRHVLREIVLGVIDQDARASSTEDAETGQVILRATDERHLRALVAAVSVRIGEKIVFGSPQVAYREAFERAAKADYAHKKHVGPAYQFGRVIMKIDPGPRGSGVHFSNAAEPENLPFEYVSAIEQGVFDVAATGIFMGFPIVDFTATLIDAAYHDIDSSAFAFRMAARGAVRLAGEMAGIKLLEPVMQVSILTRPHWREQVEQNLVRRRAIIRETSEQSIVLASVPLASLFGFEDELMELTGGEASVAMLWDRYTEMPSTPTDPDDTIPAAAAFRA